MVDALESFIELIESDVVSAVIATFGMANPMGGSGIAPPERINICCADSDLPSSAILDTGVVHGAVLICGTECSDRFKGSTPFIPENGTASAMAFVFRSNNGKFGNSGTADIWIFCNELAVIRAEGTTTGWVVSGN